MLILNANVIVKAHIRPSRRLLLVTKYRVTIETINSMAATTILSTATARFIFRMEKMAIDSST